MRNLLLLLVVCVFPSCAALKGGAGSGAARAIAITAVQAAVIKRYEQDPESTRDAVSIALALLRGEEALPLEAIKDPATKLAAQNLFLTYRDQALDAKDSAEWLTTLETALSLLASQYGLEGSK